MNTITCPARDEISEYFLEIKNIFEGNNCEDKAPYSIEHNFINYKECYYVFSLTEGEIVYHEGVDSLFGYDKKDISYEFLLENYHPEDIEHVVSIVKGTISHCVSTPFACKDSILQMTYAIKKSDGAYTKVLSQSKVYKMNSEGIPSHIFVKLTDIGSLDTQPFVNWSFISNSVHPNEHKRHVCKAYRDFFSKRELDVILEMKNGLTNKMIAHKLFISEHTVATHRKNIFKKSNRHSTDELVVFCKRKGII